MNPYIFMNRNKFVGRGMTTTTTTTTLFYGYSMDMVMATRDDDYKQAPYMP
jgi:hypothetical protein